MLWLKAKGKNLAPQSRGFYLFALKCFDERLGIQNHAKFVILAIVPNLNRSPRLQRNYKDDSPGSCCQIMESSTIGA